MLKKNKNIIIYQAKSGAIEFRGNFLRDTIWATQADLVKLYQKDQSVISRHINNIFKDKEVEKKSNMRFLHITNSDKPVKFYSLDIILAVGYRTNSARAMEFRKWATKILRQHITKGYTLNKKVLKNNYRDFLKTVDDIKLLAEKNEKVSKSDVLELIKTFSSTWFNLESYDKQNFPEKGKIKKKIRIGFREFARELYREIKIFKKELIKKREVLRFIILLNIFLSI